MFKYKLKNNNIFINIWYNIGIHMKWFKVYDKKRDEALENAKQALEEAFTPRLRKMLEDKLVDEK